MTEEARQEAADYWNLPASEITDWDVETMIDQVFAVETAGEHERDNYARGLDLISDEEYQEAERDRREYEDSAKAGLASRFEIALGTPAPARVIAARRWIEKIPAGANCQPF